MKCKYKVHFLSIIMTLRITQFTNNEITQNFIQFMHNYHSSQFTTDRGCLNAAKRIISGYFLHREITKEARIQRMNVLSNNNILPHVLSYLEARKLIELAKTCKHSDEDQTATTTH